MKVVKKEVTSLNDLDVPSPLYKYRHFNNPDHLRIFTEREIYFASPSTFEDPLDCKIPVRYDLLTDKEIYEKYYFDSRDYHPDWSRQQHRKWARDWAKKSPIKDKEGIQRLTEESFLEYNKRIGILSLTANSKSLDMWKKYSNDNSGFCVGFAAKKLFRHLGGGGQVNYDFDELPIIWPTPKHSYEEQRQLQVFSKLRKWSFEAEYRTLIFDPNELSEGKRKCVLPKDVFLEVILGSQISEENEDLIKKLTEEFDHLNIRKQRIENGIVVIE